MKTKKTLLTILAVVLICAISITGTLAFLQDTADEAVVNTFVAAGDGSLFKNATGAVVLNESKAVRAEDTGAYSLDTADKVFANSYSVLPGTTVLKDPAISVTEKNDVPAYVFVEIVDATGVNLTWTIADGWVATNVTGPNGGTVYHLPNAIVADLAATPILKDNKITVGDVEDLGLGDEGKTMTFYGYLAQSVVNDSTEPADVFTACFLDND